VGNSIPDIERMVHVMDLAGGSVKCMDALSPNSDTGGSAVDGIIIDRKGFYSAVFHCLIGDVTGTPSAQSAVFKVEEGDASDLSDASDVAGATITITTVDTAGEINLDLRSRKRYLRLTQTTTLTGGSSPEIRNAGSCVLGDPDVKPQ
jgi:hypothetical protein